MGEHALDGLAAGRASGERECRRTMLKAVAAEATRQRERGVDMKRHRLTLSGVRRGGEAKQGERSARRDERRGGEASPMNVGAA